MNINSVISAMIEQLQLQKKSDNSTNNVSAKESVAFKDYLSNASTTTMDQVFEEAAETYDVDVNLLRAIGMAESSFRADATSRSGAQGIMQLMPKTAESLGVKDAYDVRQNIFGGAKYISQLLKQYDGNITLALAAYNAGPHNVDKYGGVPPFEQTQNYVVNVQNYYENGIQIPSDRNIVSSTGSSANVLEAASARENATIIANAITTALQQNGLSVSDEENNITHIWNTDLNEAQLTKAMSGTDSDALLTRLQTLLQSMNEDDSEFSYEDYGRFLKVYLDRVSLSTFQNAVDGKDPSIPEELEEALNEFQAEMNGENTTTTNLDSLYSYQSINYNPTVLKLMTGRTEE